MANIQLEQQQSYLTISLYISESIKKTYWMNSVCSTECVAGTLRKAEVLDFPSFDKFWHGSYCLFNRRLRVGTVDIINTFQITIQLRHLPMQIIKIHIFDLRSKSLNRLLECLGDIFFTSVDTFGACWESKFGRQEDILSFSWMCFKPTLQKIRLIKSYNILNRLDWPFGEKNLVIIVYIRSVPVCASFSKNWI